MMNILLTQAISFPHLGITIKGLPASFQLSDSASLYISGILVGLAIILAYFIIRWQADVTNQDREMYIGLAVPVVFFSVVGARIFYILFSIDKVGDRPELMSILNGGMSWYGALFAGALTVFIYTKVKKLPLYKIFDTVSAGILAGQALGKWGDFFSRRNFGRYTDNLFAMRLSVEDVEQKNITSLMLAAAEKKGYTGYIQVHPLFLYESVAEIFLLIFILFYFRHKKFNGEIFLIYLTGYGLIRFLTEGLRVTSLKIWGTSVAVSQAISLVMAVTCISLLIVKRTDAEAKSKG